MKPIQVDVIAPIPEEWGLCITCDALMTQAGLVVSQGQQPSELFPPDWMEDFKKLSDFILALKASFNGKLTIRVMDPRSPQGMVLALKNRIGRYPAFIIRGHGKVVGLHPEEVEDILRRGGCLKEDPE